MSARDSLIRKANEYNSYDQLRYRVVDAIHDAAEKGQYSYIVTTEYNINFDNRKEYYDKIADELKLGKLTVQRIDDSNKSIEMIVSWYPEEEK